MQFRPTALWAIFALVCLATIPLSVWGLRSFPAPDPSVSCPVTIKHRGKAAENLRRLQVGQPAPDFGLIALEETRPVHLSDLRGHTVVLFFGSYT